MINLSWGTNLVIKERPFFVILISGETTDFLEIAKIYRFHSILGAKPPKILVLHDKFVSKNESDNKETVEIKGPLYRLSLIHI